VVPDYELSINCAQLPADTAKQQVPVDGLQILRLRIAGVDYSEQLRVQIFPESDVNISGINGEAPNEVVRLADLETGRPVIAPLPHGSLTLQQTTEASGGAAAISTPPAAAAREWLSFSLSCAPPAIAVGS
jgi:hypothetical protein